jgi:hypothetical protein
VKRRWILHPLLFSIYPVASLLAANLGQISETMAIRSLVVSVAGAAILTAVFRLLSRDWDRAALVASAVLIVFFSYGHVYTLLKTVSVGGAIVGRHRYLVPIAGGLIALWCFWVLRWLKDPRVLRAIFNVAGAFALAFPVYSMLAYHLTSPRYGVGTTQEGAGDHGTTVPVASGTPDIYYIILDAYGRQDVLRDFYGCDNSDFLAGLKESGFYVASGSRSNYLESVLSMASSLNMEYLDNVAEAMGAESEDLRPLADLLAHSRVRSFLQDRGYRMVAFESGWPLTQVEDADIYLSPDAQSRSSAYLFGPPNEFELLLLRSTMARAVLDEYRGQMQTVDSPLEAPFSRQRDRILFSLDKLGDVAGWEGNYFVFAHLVIPHPPFVFGPSGEPILHNRQYSFSDGSAFEGTREEYINGYCGQVAYIDSQVLPLVRRLIRDSDTPPVIILQGDHGPRLDLDWHDPDRTNMRESFSILNAYYVMGLEDLPLYPSISPVNSFRVLLDVIFGQELALLPDRSYYTDSFRPYDFLDVTSRTLSD